MYPKGVCATEGHDFPMSRAWVSLGWLRWLGPGQLRWQPTCRMQILSSQVNPGGISTHSKRRILLRLDSNIYFPNYNYFDQRSKLNPWITYPLSLVHADGETAGVEGTVGRSVPIDFGYSGEFVHLHGQGPCHLLQRQLRHRQARRRQCLRYVASDYHQKQKSAQLLSSSSCFPSTS